MYQTNQPTAKVVQTYKVYVKESEIKDKVQKTFNGPFQILEIHDNSAILLNLRTNQRTKVNFDSM